MPFTLSIPKVDGGTISLALGPGDQLFVLGANGTGKSSLMHHIYTAFPEQVRHVSAHRQNWFPSSELTLSPHQKRQTEANIRNADLNPQARWKDDYSGQRPGIALYDLVDAENVRARTITEAIDANNIGLAQKLSERGAPVVQINELLRAADIQIKIVIRPGGEVRAVRAEGIEYGVSELSDGERNALLVAANVLTATADTLVLIDEPERHLHRSIISPLLTHLFAARPDCTFVISTHEIMLPVDNPAAHTLLVRACIYASQKPVAWDADLLVPGTDIQEDIRRDILGARRRLLFVEGGATSLDRPLYALLFPSVSVVARQSCREVEHAVIGIRASGALHWLQAFGIVDNDRRTLPDISRLADNGVYALSVYSIESIYYHPLVQRRVATRHVAVVGGEAESALSRATALILEAATQHRDRLAERAAEKAVREEVFRHLPRREDISAGRRMSMTIDVATIVAEERGLLESAIERRDVETILSRYPMRETPALHSTAQSLGFQGRTQYEAAVLKMLIDDADARADVRGLFGSLVAAVEAA